MTAPTYPCAICGKRGKAEMMLFSKHTRRRYCQDLKACEKQRKKNLKTTSQKGET